MITAILECTANGAGSCRNEIMILQLRKAVEDALDWLENAPISYANGNTHDGLDEGDVLGGRYHEKLTAQLRAALNADHVEQSGNSILREQLAIAIKERDTFRSDAIVWRTRFKSVVETGY